MNEVNFVWCKCAKLDRDTGRYDCSVSGSECMFIIPNAVACARKYGEGPLCDLMSEEMIEDGNHLDHEPERNGT